MQLIVSESTQQRLAEHMATYGFATLDETIENLLDEVAAAAGPPSLQGVPTDGDLDAALDEAERDPGVPWAEAKAELMARYGIREA